jgi:hypothetical protein
VVAGALLTISQQDIGLSRPVITKADGAFDDSKRGWNDHEKPIAQLAETAARDLRIFSYRRAATGTLS